MRPSIFEFLLVILAKSLAAQGGHTTAQIADRLAEKLVVKFAQGTTLPCVLASPFGSDPFLRSIARYSDSLSESLPQHRAATAPPSTLHWLLLDSASTDPASLDSLNRQLLSAVADWVNTAGRPVDTTHLRELGVFALRVGRDTTAVGLAYGGYENTIYGDAFWDAFVYWFDRHGSDWRLIADTALFYADGRVTGFPLRPPKRLSECLH